MAMIKAITITIFIFIVVDISAQIHYGFKAGVNISKVEEKNIPEWASLDYESNFGLHLGVFTEIKLSADLSLAPEMQYTQRGYKLSGYFGLPRPLNLQINYLEMPLLISYSPLKFIAVEAGPNVGVMLSVRNKRTGDRFSGLSLHKFDYGVSGGLRFNVMRKWLIITRYYYAISPAVDYEAYSEVQDPAKGTLHNRNIQISIAYKLK